MNEVQPRSAEAAERIRLRYPRSRVPRPVAITLIAALAAVGLGWMIWAGYTYATPQVDGQVSTYDVTDDRTVIVQLTVQRRDPAIPATCTLVAEATDFETVGEREVKIPAGTAELTNLDVSIVTLRRATTAVVKGCTSEG